MFICLLFIGIQIRSRYEMTVTFWAISLRLLMPFSPFKWYGYFIPTAYYEKRRFHINDLTAIVKCLWDEFSHECNVIYLRMDIIAMDCFCAAPFRNFQKMS
jgi:hypothetical protein